MKKVFLVATLTITTGILSTAFFYSPITAGIDSYTLYQGIDMDEPLTHLNVTVQVDADMSAYKGALFSEPQVFRERA